VAEVERTAHRERLGCQATDSCSASLKRAANACIAGRLLPYMYKNAGAARGAVGYGKKESPETGQLCRVCGGGSTARSRQESQLS
jgi:hypothetical protein